jgi:hypothetical protein
MAEAQQPSNRNDALAKIREHSDTKVLSFFSGYKGLMIIWRTVSILI